MPELHPDKEVRSAQNLPPPKVGRVMVLVKRGPTESIGRTCFRHEVPILEEIFGEGNVSEITDTDPDGRRLMKYAIRAKGPVIFSEDEDEDGNVTPTPKHYDPSEDPREEYNRLGQVYGMHNEVNLTVVEKVYGPFREGRFTAAVMGGRVGGKVQRKLSVDDISTMKGSEIQQKLAEMDIEYDPTASVKSLRSQLIGALE